MSKFLKKLTSLIVYFQPSAAKNTWSFGAKKRRKAGTLCEIKPLEYSEERAALEEKIKKGVAQKQ
jgi:hypothetical protein